jgi:hypothetical protein
MSHKWKLLPIAALFALGLVLLLPGSVSNPLQPDVALAACDTETGTININIRDIDTGSRVDLSGSVVIISPRPATGTGTTALTDDNSPDQSATHGLIRLTNVCGNNQYTATLDSVPATFSDCDVITDQDSGTITGSNTITLDLEIDCSAVSLTPTVTVTVTPTGTVGAAKTVITSASPNSVGCGGTSIVTVQVKDGAGNPVAIGTAVQLTATKGTVNPPSGSTTAADGSVFVFYAAKDAANNNISGGSVDITATAGTASGKTTITVNCNAAPTNTTAPPPTVSSGGVISPPNTGDAGLSRDSGWRTFAGIALVVASVVGTLLLVRGRIRA